MNRSLRAALAVALMSSCTVLGTVYTAESSSERSSAAAPVRPADVGEQARTPDPVGPLGLRETLALVIERSPELQSYAWEVRARDAHVLQASRLPNPELRSDIENVAGSGDREATEDTESTIRLAQLVELGGKRGARRRIAELESTLAAWDYDAKRLHVLHEASRAFTQTLVAQERVALATELERLAARAVRAAADQVGAGAAVPVETTRAQVAIGKAEVERRRVDHELVVARANLAATWGSLEPTFSHVLGDLTRVDAPPSSGDALARLDANPDVARWATEIEEREATLALERAGRVPDVTVGAGGRHFSDNGDNALVFELSVPLPVFDRRDAAIAEAGHRVQKARSDRTAAYVGARAALRGAVARATAAYEQAIRLRTQVLPAARKALDQTFDAYRKGALRSIDVLDAQRTEFELRGDYLTVLESYHLAAADLERLTAALGRGPIEGENR